jgi:hypothetical protein
MHVNPVTDDSAHRFDVEHRIASSKTREVEETDFQVIVLALHDLLNQQDFRDLNSRIGIT